MPDSELLNLVEMCRANVAGLHHYGAPDSIIDPCVAKRDEYIAEAQRRGLEIPAEQD